MKCTREAGCCEGRGARAILARESPQHPVAGNQVGHRVLGKALDGDVFFPGIQELQVADPPRRAHQQTGAEGTWVQAKAQLQALSAAAHLAGGHGLHRHQEIVQAARTGEAGSERRLEDTGRIPRQQPGVPAVRCWSQRLGLTPAQLRNNLWKWKLLRPTCLATSSSLGWEREWVFR